MLSPAVKELKSKLQTKAKHRHRPHKMVKKKLPDGSGAICREEAAVATPLPSTTSTVWRYRVVCGSVGFEFLQAPGDVVARWCPSIVPSSHGPRAELRERARSAYSEMSKVRSPGHATSPRLHSGTLNACILEYSIHGSISPCAKHGADIDENAESHIRRRGRMVVGLECFTDLAQWLVLIAATWCQPHKNRTTVAAPPSTLVAIVPTAAPVSPATPPAPLQKPPLPPIRRAQKPEQTERASAGPDAFAAKRQMFSPAPAPAVPAQKPERIERTPSDGQANVDAFAATRQFSPAPRAVSSGAAKPPSDKGVHGKLAALKAKEDAAKEPTVKKTWKVGPGGGYKKSIVTGSGAPARAAKKSLADLP